MCLSMFSGVSLAKAYSPLTARELSSGEHAQRQAEEAAHAERKAEEEPKAEEERKATEDAEAEDGIHPIGNHGRQSGGVRSAFH